MFDRLKPKSEFSKNVLTLMTGTTIAQAIPIAISPILTRLYTPQDFGIFALYMSIVSIIGVIVTGKYELAIMLPNNERDATNVFFLSIIVTILISLTVFFAILLFNEQISILLNNKEINEWLYLIPLSVLLVGVFNSFNYYYNRNKNYKLLSKNKVVQSFTNGSSNLIFGFLKLNNIGLIVSHMVSQSITVFVFMKKFNSSNLEQFNKKRIIVLAKRYKKFPKVTMPHSIFSSFSQNLPIFIITKYFTNSDVGFYSFGNRIVAMPIELVSSAYYQVFFESFSKEKNKLCFYRHKFKLVNMIFLPLFIVLWFFLPDIFAIVFSEQWRVAGEYSQILLPLLYMKFLSNLFTTTTYIYYQKQEENFILGILITFLIFISLMIGVCYNDIEIGLLSMVVSNGSVILFKLYRSYNFVKGSGAKSI